MKEKISFKNKRDTKDLKDEKKDHESTSTHQGDATDKTDITEVEEELTAQTSSLADKLKSSFSVFSKKKNSQNGSEDSEEDEALKKKKKSKIIQIAIAVGLVIFLLSDYIFPPEEHQVDPATLLKPRAKKEVTTPNAEPAAEPTDESISEPSAEPTDEPISEPSTEPTDESISEPSTEPTDEPISEPSTEPTDEPISEPSTEPTDGPISEPSTEPTDESISGPLTEPTTDSVPDFSEHGSSEPSPDHTETPSPDVSDETMDIIDPLNVPSTDSVDGVKTPSVGEDNLTEQILLDLEKQAKDTKVTNQKKEYVSPPDYEYKGRGLVYNCTGKHWACVDAPSYKACEENASSVKYLNKKIECYPFNVYETNKGCEDIQNRMVSSSAKTNFCSE